MRQIAIVGLGKFGSTVARELTERGAQVIAIDEQKERVEELKEFVTYAVTANATDENALRALGIQDVDAAAICIGEDVEANLLTTLLLKKLGIKEIWARAISPLQQEILRALEVDYIINLEEEMGNIVANSLVSANVIRYIPIASKYSLAELKVPESFTGKTIRQIDPRGRFQVNIVAIKKKIPKISEYGERILVESLEDISFPDKPLESEDILVAVGRDKDIEKFAAGG
ncbi:MAG: potassium channel family protein [bacterium]